MTIGQIGMLASAVVALCIIGRIVFLCLFRTQVVGQLIRHDYDDAERQYERLSMQLTLGQSSGWGEPTDQIPVRTVCTKVGYSWNGKDYRRDVNVTVVKGWEPKSSLKLWIDPKNPNDVTVNGPSYWFCWLFFVSIFALGFYHLPV